MTGPVTPRGTGVTPRNIGPGYYELEVNWAGGTLCLTAGEAFDAVGLFWYVPDGAPVYLEPCGQYDAQLWHKDSGGHFIVDVAFTNNGQDHCLDAKLQTPGDGGTIQAWTCNGGVQQRWDWDTNFPKAIQSHWNGKCADADVNHMGAGDTISLWGCVNKKYNQQWIPYA